MTGSAKRNLKALQALCGGDYSSGVVIIYTHWTDKGEARRRNEEEKRVVQFSESFWKRLIDNGARIDRLECYSSGVPFDGNSADHREARRILRDVLDTETQQRATKSSTQTEHDTCKIVL
jgi:hypothetical protein